MMSGQPLVTIGIPTYNSGRYLSQCLESILRQTYTNLEIIVSDNGSTDDTEKIIFSYGDARIKFNKNRENLYCYGNYNVILSLARGEFLAFYHSDDVYLPDMVEKEVNFLLGCPEAAAVFTEAYKIDEAGRIIGERNLPRKFSGVNIMDFEKAYNGFLESCGFLICPSAMFVKEIFSKVGNFKKENFFSDPEAARWISLLQKYGLDKNSTFTANDLEMWLRIMQKRPVGIIHEKLMYYRVHSGQGSQKFDTNSEIFFIVMDYYAGYAGEKDIISKISWRKYGILKSVEEFASGQKALMKGDFKSARKYYISFLKSPYFLRMCFSYENLIRIIWVFIASGMILFKCGAFSRKILVYWRAGGKK
ncbi:MAG TPA: glycosyltransferase family 2 protein [bacterium]|nr:glycosyltransferase family 2 protein [bacterium]